MGHANDTRDRDSIAAPSPAQINEDKSRPLKGVCHVVVTTAFGSAFGGMVALTIANLPNHYDPTAPWWMLKMSSQDLGELLGAIVITLIAVFFIEPLIEYIRWGVRGTGHDWLTSSLKSPSRLNWLYKAALGMAFVLVIMSQEAIRPYVSWELLKASPEHKAIAFEVLGAAAVISGTTVAWACGARFRLATAVGCLTSFSLAAGFVLVYTPFKDGVSPRLETHIYHERPMTPTAVKADVPTAKKPPGNEEKIVSAEKNAAEVADAAPSRTKAIVADKPARESTNAGHRIEVPIPAPENTNIDDETTGSNGKSYSLSFLNKTLAFVLYATVAWVAVGLVGGFLIDYVRIAKPSTTLVIGVFSVTWLCDVAFQLWLWDRKFAPIEAILWAGLGAGWAASILIVAPSVDAIFGRRDKDVPALLVNAISRRWQKQTHPKA